MTSRPTPAWWRRRSRDAPDAALMQRLAAAIGDGDATAMRMLLAPASRLVIDGGAVAESGELRGRDAVAIALASAPSEVAIVSMNGAPGLAILQRGQVVATLSVSVHRRLITAAWSVRNPDKLRHWNR